MKPSAAHTMAATNATAAGTTNATAAGTTSFQNSPSFQPYRMTAHVMAVTAATPNVAEAPKNHSRP